MFSSKSFIVFGLTFKSLIHFEFFFLCMVLASVLVSFTSSCLVFPAPLIEEIVFSPLYILDSFVKNKVPMCLVAQPCLTLCDPMDGSPPGSSVHGDSPGKNTGVGCHTLLQGIFSTQTEHRSSSLQVDYLPSELPEKPKVPTGEFYLWTFYLVPFVYISVFEPVPYCLDDCSFVV